MVEGKPYVHFNVINEREIEDSTSDYLWATTVECNRGPVFEPVTVTSAEAAFNIFGVDVAPFFANGGRALTIIRVAAWNDSTSSGNALTRGSYSFSLSEDCEFSQVENLYYGDLLEAEIKQIGGQDIYQITDDDLTKALTSYFRDFQAEDEGSVVCEATKIGAFEDDTFKTAVPLYVNKDTPIEIDPLNLDKNFSTEKRTIDVRSIFNNTLVAYVKLEDDDGNASYVPVYNENGVWKPIKEINISGSGQQATFVTVDTTEDINGIIPDSSVRYAKMLVNYTIRAATPIINFAARYPGDYKIVVGCDTGISDNGYNITISEEDRPSVLLKNVTSLKKIVSRINDREYNLVASLTEAGNIINEISSEKLYIIPVSGNVADKINSYKPNRYANFAQSKSTTVAEPYQYKIGYVIHELENGRNGYWDDEEQRIEAAYRQEAHTAGLQLLEDRRVSGIYCTYQDESITNAYIAHAAKMNDGEVCKWRTVLIGAREEDRTLAGLTATAIAINNQYCLYLGQGLMDSGYYVPPYLATAYVAGLRSKLFYGDAIFGGESKKELKPAYGGKLDIAPLFEYEDSLIWQPEIYTELNEAGVMTFTKEYGQISLTDGVTTTQYPSEEDEEGIISILKYAQNHVYDVCVGHIGKNIHPDTESSLKMKIQSVLNDMKTIDKTLIDVEDGENSFSAYDVDVVINSRKNQLLGRIYVYIKITPVHALRQIEVEMTVQ